MPIDGFEVGKYYRYTGNRRLNYWNDNGKMDFVLDNEPHLCVRGGGRLAAFEDDPRGWAWSWDNGFELWEEAEQEPEELVTKFPIKKLKIRRLKEVLK